jgi:hypothetical protein
MKTYKSLVKLGNEEKIVVAVNYSNEEKKTEEVEVDRLHHIHILDRSGSMSWDLPKLIENVKETLDLMSDNDLISVIWFSGEKQCKTVFKGKSKRDKEDIVKILDTLKNTVGLTCFSEPLREVNEVIEDLKVLCENFSVTFFTDGQPCVYDYDAEMKAIWENMDVIKGKVMALNAIGYGSYYDKELLEKMTGMTNFGRLIHSSQINDYADIFSHNYAILSDMIVERVNIHVSEPAEILYLTSKNTKHTRDALQLDFLNKTKNQFFFVVDSEDTVISINDEEIRVSDVKSKIQAPTLKNFLYAMAYELYYLGRGEDSLDIMAHSLKDKAFIDQHINAFTAEERQEYLESINKAIFVNKNRFADGEAPEGYIPANDAFCVMDLLKVLSSGDNYYIPLSSSEYKRIGLKVNDGFNLFEGNKDLVLAPINELVFNAKHLNISVRYMVNGQVNLNPIEAKRVGLEKQIPSQIYRMQTIIKDGNLNMDKMKARIDKKTYNDIAFLHSQGKLVISDLITELTSVYKDENSMEFDFIDVTFDLTKLPIINRQYSELSTLENIIETVREVNVLKARQKVFKYYIDQLKSKSYSMKKTGEFSSYNADQIKVLEAHGLNSKLDYTGIDLGKAEKSEDDYYESRLLEFTLKGWSSLPKVDDVISGKKKNDPAKSMQVAINMAEAIINTESMKEKEKLDNLSSMLDATKQNILVHTINTNIQKMAKVLTGGWWEGLEVNKKQDFEFTNDYGTLIIKNGMTKVYF